MWLYVHSKVSLLITLLSLVYHLEYNCVLYNFVYINIRKVWYLLMCKVKVVHYYARFRNVWCNVMCWYRDVRCT